MTLCNTDITQAPRDGAELLIYDSNGVKDVVFWCNESECWNGEIKNYDDESIDFWMKIRTPPKKKHKCEKEGLVCMYVEGTGLVLSIKSSLTLALGCTYCPHCGQAAEEKK